MKNDNLGLLVNTKCVVCGREIEEPRKGKLYCSDVCKSRAYREDKKQKEITKKSIEAKRFEFSYSEYQQVIKNVGFNSDELNFEMYCYYRYNIKKDATIDELKNVFISINPRDIERGGIASEAYSNFLNIFHNSGYLEVIS